MGTSVSDYGAGKTRKRKNEGKTDIQKVKKTMRIPIGGQGNPERPLKPKETKYKIPLSLEVSGHVFINALTLRDAVTKAWRLDNPESQIIEARVIEDSLFIDEDKAKEMNPENDKL